MVVLIYISLIVSDVEYLFTCLLAICMCAHTFLFVAEQSAGFNLDFEVSGIYGYVMLDGVLPSLRAVTCTFWMKSSDTTNYGTPISYALENGSDNTFLLTDYNG